MIHHSLRLLISTQSSCVVTAPLVLRWQRNDGGMLVVPIKRERKIESSESKVQKSLKAYWPLNRPFPKLDETRGSSSDTKAAFHTTVDKALV